MNKLSIALSCSADQELCIFSDTYYEIIFQEQGYISNRTYFSH